MFNNTPCSFVSGMRVLCELESRNQNLFVELFVKIALSSNNGLEARENIKEGNKQAKIYVGRSPNMMRCEYD